MRKRTRILTAALGAVLLPATLALLHAEAAAGGSSTTLGPISLTWGAPGKIVGDHLVLPGGVHMSSTNYDLKAETVTVDLSSGKNAVGPVSKATAVGSPAKNTQVDGRFESVALARTYLVSGDQAVYTPAADRKDGGKIEFTGHVVIRLKAPQALSGDAVTHVEHATVLLGIGADYPQVEFGAGHLEFTPLQ